jgi:hypothetical protein
MDSASDTNQVPDVSPEERAVNESVKRILKLRWMGLHAEVECRNWKARKTRSEPLSFVLVTPSTRREFRF